MRSDVVKRRTVRKKCNWYIQKFNNWCYLQGSIRIRRLGCLWDTDFQSQIYHCRSIVDFLCLFFFVFILEHQ